MAETALGTEDKPDSDASNENSPDAGAPAESAEDQAQGPAADSEASTDPKPPKKGKAKGSAVPSPTEGGSNFITVRDRYSLYYDRPIPSLDMPTATAFRG